MTGKIAALGALALTIALAGCGSSGTKAASSPTTSPTSSLASAAAVPAAAASPASTGSPIAQATLSTATSTGAAATGGGCGGFTAGQNGVIQTFCDGKASAVVTIGSTTTKLSGGECAESGGFFTVNIGVITSSTYAGARPDYLGADLPDKVGAFTKTAFPVHIGGVAHLISATGTIASGFSGVTASGAELTGADVSVTVTC